MHNANVQLRGPRLRLVPYLRPFVPLYHSWLLRPELLELTCSEPLSLAEEYDNQRTWLEADDKLTFILLAPELTTTTPQSLPLPATADCQNDDVARNSHNTVTTPPSAAAGPQRWRAVGDCNLFLNGRDDLVEV